MEIPEIAKVIKKPETIKNIKKPTLDLCIAALMQDGLLLKSIPISIFTRNEYFFMCKAAIFQNPKTFSIIDQNKLTQYSWKKLLDWAVNNDGLCLRWIKKQTPELCLDAVLQNPKAIKYVNKNMCDFINRYCYEYIQKAAKEKAIEIKNEPRTRTKNKNKEKKVDLLKLRKQDEQICLKAVQQDGLQLKYVWKQTRTICNVATKQNPKAVNYIRNDDHNIDINDTLGSIADAFGGISNSMEELTFSLSDIFSKKIPKALKICEKQQNILPNSKKYYQQCVKEIDDNFCNFKYINHNLLTSKQYLKLCIKAIKMHPAVLNFVNTKEIAQVFYYELCCNLFTTMAVFQIKSLLTKYIKLEFLSVEQYYNLLLTLAINVKYNIPNLIQFINEKKLGNNKYFSICSKIISNNSFAIEDVKSQYLSKSQYAKLCYISVRKEPYCFKYMDKLWLTKKDWLELTKSFILKYSNYLYSLDNFPKELLELALQKGSGLKYITRQNYNLCSSVLRKNGWELCYVKPEQFSSKQYFNLCRIAIEKNGYAISSVDDKILDNDQYQKLCMIAIKYSILTIKCINQEKIKPYLFNMWYKKAASKNFDILKDIPFSNLYYNLCLKAVTKDGKNLRYVNYLRFSKKQYKEICSVAIKNTKEAKQYIASVNK